MKHTFKNKIINKQSNKTMRKTVAKYRMI
jgi:hypothetical protein